MTIASFLSLPARPPDTAAVADDHGRPQTTDDRPRRFAVAAGVVGLWMGFGLALRLGAVPYLLAGIPITAAFQLLIARRPILSLWLLNRRPFHLDRRATVLAVALAILPLYITMSGVASGHILDVGYGLAAIAGAAPAAIALGAMDDVARRALVRSILTAGLVGGVLFLLNTVLSRGAGFMVNPAGAIQAFGVSLLLYIPLVFVLEEVFFRGALDTYVRGAHLANDRTSAVFVSVLWGLWHLPLVIATIGLSQVLMILTYHLIVGVLLTFPWRLSGNLAVPGVTHALIDAIRDGLAVR